MYLGDNLIQQGDLSSFLDKFTQQQPDALILLREVTNPSAFGVAKVDEKGKVLQLIEKPKVPPVKFSIGRGLFFFASYP